MLGNVFEFLGKCLGAAVIFKGVDVAVDSIRERREMQARLMLLQLEKEYEERLKRVEGRGASDRK